MQKDKGNNDKLKSNLSRKHCFNEKALPLIASNDSINLNLHVKGKLQHPPFFWLSASKFASIKRPGPLMAEVM